MSNNSYMYMMYVYVKKHKQSQERKTLWKFTIIIGFNDVKPLGNYYPN